MKKLAVNIVISLFCIPALFAGGTAKIVTEKAGKFAVMKPADGLQTLKTAGGGQEPLRLSWERGKRKSNEDGFVYLSIEIVAARNASWNISGQIDHNIVPDTSKIDIIITAFMPADINDTECDDIESCTQKFSKKAFSRRYKLADIAIGPVSFMKFFVGESDLDNHESSGKGYLNGLIRFKLELEDRETGESWGSTDSMPSYASGGFINDSWIAPFYKARATVWTYPYVALGQSANSTVDIIRFNKHAFNKIDSLGEGQFNKLVNAHFYYKNMADLQSFLNANNIGYQVTSFTSAENDHYSSNDLLLLEDSPVCYLVMTKFNGSQTVDGVTYSKTAFSDYSDSFILYELNDKGEEINQSACWENVGIADIKATEEAIIKQIGDTLQGIKKFDLYNMGGVKVGSSNSDGIMYLQTFPAGVYIGVDEDGRNKKVIKQR